MSDELVKTGVDELLDLLSGNSKIPLAEVATKLKVDAGVVQAWVDFLVEEGIVGIEYKFTTPYIYLNKSLENQAGRSKENEETINLQYFKKQFWLKARSNNIPDLQIETLWRNHILQALELQKKYFYFEAQRRKLGNADKLWNEYRELMQYS
ncbi:MAG TPA: hypothetical protein VEC16_04740 [Alphaproteobacteria bacterium]|nr:hypothetical protein [Alphaproteobacteria bacterium]